MNSTCLVVRKVFQGAILMFLFLLLHQGANADGCPAHSSPYREEQSGDEIVIHCKCDSGYIKVKGKCINATEWTAAQTKVRDLQNKVAMDQQAVRNLGFNTRAEDFEAWAKLRDNAQKEFEQQTNEAIREVALDLAEVVLIAGISNIGSLSPPMANRRITQLKSLGVNDPFLFDLIRGIANTPNKPEKAKLANEIVKHMRDAKDIWGILKTNSAEAENAKWEAGALMLGEIIPDPRLRLLAKVTLQDVRFAYYSVNAGVVELVGRPQVNRLTELTEEQLLSLRHLSSLLQAHVDQLNKAKQDLAALE